MSKVDYKNVKIGSKWVSACGEYELEVTGESTVVGRFQVRFTKSSGPRWAWGVGATFSDFSLNGTTKFVPKKSKKNYKKMYKKLVAELNDPINHCSAQLLGNDKVIPVAYLYTYIMNKAN